MPLFPISSFQAAQSGEQNVKIKKDEITVTPEQGGGGGDTSNCFKYEQGDFIKNSQNDGEQKLLVLNEETNDGSMIDMTTSNVDTFVAFVDPDGQDVTSGLNISQSEVSLNVNEYEDESHNHSSASMKLYVDEWGTKKSEIISKTTIFGEDSANVSIEEHAEVMPFNEEFMENDVLASYNLGSGTDATDESISGFAIGGSMMVGNVEAGEITKSIFGITAGSNSIVCMSDGTTIIGNQGDPDKQLVIKDGEIQGGGGGGGSKQYRHSMYIEFSSTESGYGNCAVIYNYFSNVDHSLWRDYQEGTITAEDLKEMATEFIDNAQKYSANPMWLPPHIGGYVSKDGERSTPIHSVIRHDDNVYVHAIDGVSGAGRISQAWITDVVEGDEYPGE